MFYWAYSWKQVLQQKGLQMYILVSADIQFQ